MSTLYLEEVIHILSGLKERCGNIPVVLRDADTGWYLPLKEIDFIEQSIEDESGGIHRIVISCDYCRPREVTPIKDPLAGY